MKHLNDKLTDKIPEVLKTLKDTGRELTSIDYVNQSIWIRCEKHSTVDKLPFSYIVNGGII